MVPFKSHRCDILFLFYLNLFLEVLAIQIIIRFNNDSAQTKFTAELRLSRYIYKSFRYAQYIMMAFILTIVIWKSEEK